MLGFFRRKRKEPSKQPARNLVYRDTRENRKIVVDLSECYVTPTIPCVGAYIILPEFEGRITDVWIDYRRHTSEEDRDVAVITVQLF